MALPTIAAVLLVFRVQVQSLAEASSGGDEQVGALQKELLAVREVRLDQANTPSPA